jgi:hypothetical protein
MENEQVLLTEKQMFRQTWVIIPLMMTNVISVVLWTEYFREAEAGRATQEDLWGSIIGTSIILLTSCLMFIIQLKTKITDKGIYVQLFPFHLKYKFFAYNEMSLLYIRKYSPIGEFGGWGLRYSFNGKGKAFNVSGDMGLQLEVNGKKILIGTQRPDELKEIIQSRGFEKLPA